jgi:hypothetical protein
MKYVLMCLVMLSCFAFAGVKSTASPVTTVDPIAAPADPVPDDDDVLAATTCGGTVCGKGTYCCNASCGTCVPKGMSCTQQSCN